VISTLSIKLPCPRYKGIGHLPQCRAEILPCQRLENPVGKGEIDGEVDDAAVGGFLEQSLVDKTTPLA
jgi:hypothetical protein